MSFGEYYNGFSQLGGNFLAQQEREEQKTALSKLGDQLQSGDYSGAAGTAFKAGDLQTGINLLKLGQGQANAAQANAAFGGLAGMYGGGGGGFGVGGPVGAPGGRPAPAGGVPSFLDTDGPSGGYLAGLFKRESNNNPNAQAGTSSAKGLGQFTTGTWNATAQQHPELGLTPVGNGQDGRTDPQQMIAATKAFTADNEAILSRSGLPVNDATRYAMHFLGAGGGQRLIGGTLRNPDAPAASYADPKAVAANRNVFFNKDGTPKTAGTVLNDFARSFGGGGGRSAPQVAPQVASADPTFAPSMPGPLAPVQGMNPGQPQAAPALAQRPVQFADDEAQTQALERSMGMVPPQAAAPTPRPPQALIPQSMAGMGIPGTVMNRGVPVAQAGVPDQADMPTPDAQPAQFRIPPGPQQPAPGSIASLPAGLSSPQPRGPVAPTAPAAPALRALPPPDGAPVPTLPDAGAPPGRAMTLPGQDGGTPSPQARAQVSAQAPQRLEQVGLPPAAAQAVSAGAPGSQQRIGVLMRIAGLPGLSDAQSGVVKALLTNELEQTRLPELQKNYMLARSQGFGGTLLDYQNELRKPLTPTIVAPGNAAIAPGERAPFYVNPRAPTQVSAGSTLFDTSTGQPIYTAPDRERQTEAEKITAGAQARRQAAISQGLNPDDPRIRDFIVSGNLPKENQQQLTAGDRKAINDAEDHGLLLDQTIGTLSRAKELNPQTYTGLGAGVLGRTGTSFPGAGLVLDPKKAEASREFNQIMSMEAIKSMSSTLKGATTDREMDRFIEVLGDPATPPDIRGRTIDRMLTLAQRQKDLAQARIGQMREGTYYRPGGGASAGASGGGQGGAPALPPPSPSNRPGAVSPADRFQQLMGSGMSKAQAYQQLHSEGY